MVVRTIRIGAAGLRAAMRRCLRPDAGERRDAVAIRRARFAETGRRRIGSATAAREQEDDEGREPNQLHGLNPVPPHVGTQRPENGTNWRNSPSNRVKYCEKTAPE